MGPILFILYKSRLYHAIANEPSAICSLVCRRYANLSSLVLSATEIPRLAAVEAYISVVCTWLIQNRLRKGGLIHAIGNVFEKAKTFFASNGFQK